MALITADILNEDCSDISDWTDGDSGTGVSEVSPAGQFRFDTNTGAVGNAFASRYRTVTSPPNLFTIEIETYFDLIGTRSNNDYFGMTYHTGTWRFSTSFCSDGLYIAKTGGAVTEIGTDIVKYDATKALQTWRFLVTKDTGESLATCEIFLDNVSQGTVDCDYETTGNDGRLTLSQLGFTTDDMVSHIDYIKIGTGHGEFPATVTTEAASAVSDSGFTGNGTITELGSSDITRRGFCYKAGTVGDPFDFDSVAYDDGTFTTLESWDKAVTGLSGGTGYRVRAYVVTTGGTAYGDTVQVTTDLVAPTLTTEDCTVVLSTSCTANGTIVTTGGANPTVRGFCYVEGTSGDPTVADSEVHDTGDYSTGAYTKAITGLTAGTGYRVRAYATNSVDTAYGTTVQLTTAAANIPVVTTQAVSEVTTSSFTGNGNITDIGTSDVTTRGFCYKKSSLGTPTVSDSTAYDTGTYGTGAYTKSITGLSAGVNYNVRAYAINSTGTAYGDIVLAAITSSDVSADAEPTLSTPLDSNSPEATHVAWINSRFIANEVDTNRFDFTDTDPFTSLIENNYWGSTDNPVTCDYKGDKLTALFTAWQEIYAWGTQGLQVFQDDGSTPFVNVPGAAGEAGLEAVYSVQKMDNTIFALCVVDKKRVVVKLQGRAPVVISEPIANILAGMETVSDAIGDIICVGGIAIYLLNFPTADQTWAYDYKNDLWLRWSYYNATKGKHERFIGQHCCFVKRWNKYLIMSRLDGKIYELSRSVYDDADNDMVSYRRTGWLDWGDTSKIKQSKELFIKIKTFADDGTTDPVMLMRWRDDGYSIWSDFVELPLNPKYFGDFIIHLSRMGSYRSRQYEFRLSDEVDMALVNVQENFG
ncbi:MAG: hypothetical protein WC332_02970 [Clostridia bacterium]|jgi:hypothetical protein